MPKIAIALAVAAVITLALLAKRRGTFNRNRRSRSQNPTAYDASIGDGGRGAAGAPGWTDAGGGGDAF